MQKRRFQEFMGQGCTQETHEVVSTNGCRLLEGHTVFHGRQLLIFDKAMCQNGRSGNLPQNIYDISCTATVLFITADT
jgi:hypothetical protein